MILLTMMMLMKMVMLIISVRGSSNWARARNIDFLPGAPPSLSHSLITIKISIVIIMITVIVFDVISNLIVIIRTTFTFPLVHSF